MKVRCGRCLIVPATWSDLPRPSVDRGGCRADNEKTGGHAGVRMFKSKYLRIGIVVLLVFVIMLVWKGIGAAVFWATGTGAILFVLSFDPRIKRHW